MQQPTRFALLRAVAVALLGAGLGLATACDNKPAATTTPAAPATTTSADSTRPDMAMAYVCPMGCEGSASNTPGKCPVCEMTLEPNPAHKPTPRQ